MKTHLLFLMLVTVSTAFANIDTPVAAWDFNKIENGKVASTIGNFTATVIRQKHVSPSQGKIDSALAVRGKYKGSKAGALIVRNFKFDFAKPFTAEILVKFDAGIQRNQQREIFGIIDTERGPGIRLSFYYDSLIFTTGDGKKANVVKTNTGTLKVTCDQWHLLTVTYNGKNVVIFYDGTPAVEKEISIIPAQNKLLSIGSYKNGVAYPLMGALDDFKLYNFCKTPEQVAAQYMAIFGE